jgi:hypothetical protein
VKHAWGDLTAAQRAALGVACNPTDDMGEVVTWRGESDRTVNLVNGRAASSLAEMGLVACATNPGYAGNRLVSPTPAGRELWEGRPR